MHIGRNQRKSPKMLKLCLAGEVAVLQVDMGWEEKASTVKRHSTHPRGFLWGELECRAHSGEERVSSKRRLGS